MTTKEQLFQEMLVLIPRLDERMKNLWNIVFEDKDSINKKIDIIIIHQTKQNGSILKNTLWRKIICAVGAGWLLILTGLLITLLTGG